MMTTQKKIAKYLQFLGCASLICGGAVITFKDSPAVQYIQSVTDYNAAFDKAIEQNPDNKTCISMARSAGL